MFISQHKENQMGGPRWSLDEKENHYIDLL